MNDVNTKILYDTFVALKLTAGELIAGYTFDLFEATLLRHQERLTRAHPSTKPIYSCVLVDGRASLRVTLVPIVASTSDICW